MGKYNTAVANKPQTITNHQGGTGFKLDEKLELISILMTGLEDKYYEKETERTKRLATLIDNVGKKDPEFVAKALVYARIKGGQRSVTHLGSVNLLKHLSGNPVGSRFFSKRDKKENVGGIVYRLDDMLEITACYFVKNPNKPLPAALKRGFKMALEAADAYELAKYQGKGKAVSLVDLVNLVHPKPSKSMEKTFKDLMTGNLKQFNTVEDTNTKAGQTVAAKVKSGEITKEQAVVELAESKEENYVELIKTRKIGYLALLRNLRNILKTSTNTDLINAACGLLIDEKLIKQSLVFPHQIDIALEIMLLEFSNSQMSKFAKALNIAYELAIPNLTELFTYGKTAVVFDTSSSMHGGYKVSLYGKERKQINKRPIDLAALIGATLAKGTDADLYQFGTICAKINFNPNDSFNTIKNIGISQDGRVGHGTSFNSIFETLLKYGKYDRIFIISDMQGGDSIVGNSAYKTYKDKFGQPYIYTIDTQGYGSTMFKQDKKLIQLFGYSAAIYESIRTCEMDPKAILKEIEAIVI